jgi:hypothetical protein
MKMNRPSSWLAWFPLYILLGGCVTHQPIATSAQSHEVSQSPSNALQITDISLPGSAKLDAENSLIIGSGDRWFGRVVVKSDETPVQTYNHFFKGMPSLGWRMISAMQSKTSLLSFQRGERIAMVQIETSQLGGSTISISVSMQQPGPVK